MPGIKFLYILYLKTKFRVFQAHRHNRLVLECVHGIPLLILPQVMNPILFRTGEFLAQSLSRDLIPEGSRVLDMGTGSGVGAICAAQWASGVIAVDLNPEAVRCARINVVLNQLEDKADIRYGDLFEPVDNKERFDRIIFNPPYLKGKPSNLFEQALFGVETIETFFRQVSQYLNKDGEILLVLSTLADVEQIVEMAKINGLKAFITAEKHYINETLLIYRLSSHIMVYDK